MITALERELFGLFGLTRNSSLQGCRLEVCGMGKENVLESLQNLNAQNLKGLISVGFAGALTSTWEPLEVGIVRRVISTTPGRSRYSSYQPMAAQAKKLIDYRSRPAGLITVEKPLTSGVEKRNLAEQTGASLVDMESFWVAEYAKQKGLPFLGLRCVYDAIEEDLPPVTFSESGKGVSSPSYKAVAGWTSARPGRILQLGKFYLRSVRARHRLADSTVKLTQGLVVNRN
ncbi:MAG: hypothetical protein ACLFN4_02905 [Candidatus Acetothermia bacterium]